MSGQAKRSRVRAAQRHREQVARAIARASVFRVAGAPAVTAAVGSGDILAGIRFDVHAAREYGERLIAEARHAGVHAVVDDWRRAQGREPRLRAVSEVCGVCKGVKRDPEVPQTWENPYGDPCWGCNGTGVDTRLRKFIDGGSLSTWCEPPGLPPNVPGSALSWQASVRLGRRLIAALEGQPSECLGCGGSGDDRRTNYSESCRDCHGTGHNLHGVLPPVEWSPAVYRKVVDAVRYYRGTPSWCNAEPFTRMANLRVVTRVAPRGEHRWTVGDGVNIVAERLDDRIESRGWAPLSTFEARYMVRCEVRPPASPLPRWRRGELKHAEQRRERAAREPQVQVWRPPPGWPRPTVTVSESDDPLQWPGRGAP